MQKLIETERNNLVGKSSVVSERLLQMFVKVFRYKHTVLFEVV